jgi:hypothetical protein
MWRCAQDAHSPLGSTEADLNGHLQTESASLDFHIEYQLISAGPHSMSTDVPILPPSSTDLHILPPSDPRQIFVPTLLRMHTNSFRINSIRSPSKVQAPYMRHFTTRTSLLTTQTAKPNLKTANSGPGMNITRVLAAVRNATRRVNKGGKDPPPTNTTT